MTWGLKLGKLTSTKHKLSLLRTVHGDIYTKVKLCKYGLTDNDRCPRCEATETLEHKIYECEYVKRIWKVVADLTGEVLAPEPLKVIVGFDIHQTMSTLTIKAEILGRILGFPREQSYLVHPRHLVALAIKGLIRKETKMKLQLL